MSIHNESGRVSNRIAAGSVGRLRRGAQTTPLLLFSTEERGSLTLGLGAALAIVAMLMSIAAYMLDLSFAEICALAERSPLDLVQDLGLD